VADGMDEQKEIADQYGVSVKIACVVVMGVVVVVGY
jgi:hypothetical protein